MNIMTFNRPVPQRGVNAIPYEQTTGLCQTICLDWFSMCFKVHFVQTWPPWNRMRRVNLVQAAWNGRRLKLTNLVNWRLAFYGRPSIWEHHGYDFPQKRPGDSIVKVLQYLRPFFCTTRCNEILRRGYWKAWTENCETTFQSSIRTEYVRSWRQHV